MTTRVGFALIAVITLSMPTAPAALAKDCGFMISNAGIGKKAPAPKKLAIAAFQIRYD